MARRILKEEWWLDASSLPDLMWARLQVHNEHDAEVLDVAGQYHRFPSVGTAEAWLREDRYEELSGLIRAGSVPSTTIPPSASSDHELVPLMSRRLSPIATASKDAKRRRRGLNMPLLLLAIFAAVVVVAIKNSDTCNDRPRVVSGKGLQPGIDGSIIPCEKECCRPEPWTCKCTGRCPCIQVLRSKP
jgi:hypothetical protein